MAYLNESGEVGILINVSLKNFMCHSELRLEFGPHVNFVLGKNGSGKSAVLAAIIVALGGRSSATGRGLNVKNIIQKGKQTATISVSLKNTGNDSYEPEIYGNVITVERKLTVDGTSSYKLKSEKGVVISTKKADLNSMLRAFNIQVHNPVAILTQDVSKNFLNSKDNKDKYALFFKATQLDVLKNTYKLAEEETIATQNILDFREQVLPQLKNEIRELEKKCREYESLEKQKDQLAKLYEELAWSIVAQNEQCAARMQSLAEEIQNAVKEHKKRIQSLEADYQKAISKETIIKEQITGVQTEINNIKEQQKFVFNKKGDWKQKTREVQNDIQKFDRQIAMQEKQASYLCKSITEARNNVQKDQEVKRMQHEAKLHQHQERVKLLNKDVAIFQDKLRQGKEVRDNWKKELENYRDEERAHRYKIENKEKDITRIKQCQSNSINAYGKQVPELLRLIEKAKDSGRFRIMPIGPLGRFVKVKDQKWALAIECCLGPALLRSFLCDNGNDRDVLYDIMNSLYPGKTPQVITSKFKNKVYDVSFGQVEGSKYPTVLSMLDIADPNVMNCLIDERGIETIILIEQVPEAREVMMYRPPEKCTEAFTLKANSVYPAPSFRFYANKKKVVSLISRPENLGLNINEKTKELLLLKQAFQGFREKIAEAEKIIASEERKIRQYEAVISKSQSLILKENAEVGGMEELEEPAVIACSLENELKKTQLSLENLQNSKNEKELAFKNCLAELKKVESEEKHLREVREEKNSELAALSKSAVTTKGKSSDSFLREKNKHEVCYKEKSKELEDVQRKLAAQTASVEKKISEAEEVCPRVETRRKPENIELLIKQTEYSINKRTENTENIENLIKLLETKQEKYEEVWHDIQRLRKVVGKNQARMKHRLQAFNDLCTHVGLRVKYLFSANLHTRGYVGELKIDHKEQTLEINARPNHSSSMQSTKSLSGGEKSFITVALLLSLWDAIEIPFRILDEYDVYMDQMNRKRSMDLMMATALEHSTNQFIFLSPLEQVQIPSSKKIRIMHMPNPERQKRIRREEDEPMAVD